LRLYRSFRENDQLEIELLRGTQSLEVVLESARTGG
jgi:hypothetical protein